MTHVTYDRSAEWHEPQRGRRTGWIIVLIVVALAIILAGVFPFRQIIAQQRQVATTEEKLAALTAENQALEGEITTLQTPAEVERIAREELGLVRPGEVGYAVTPGPATHGEEVPSVGSAAEDRSFLERIWDFLTGRDLAPDG